MPKRRVKTRKRATAASRARVKRAGAVRSRSRKKPSRAQRARPARARKRPAAERVIEKVFGLPVMPERGFDTHG